MKPEPRFKRRPEFGWKELEGRVMIIDECEGAVFDLNAPAAEIWKALGDAKTLAELVDLLAAEFQAERKTLEKDARGLLKDLMRRDLITEEA